MVVVGLAEVTPGGVATNAALPAGSIPFSLKCGFTGLELIKNFHKFFC